MPLTAALTDTSYLKYIVFNVNLSSQNVYEHPILTISEEANLWDDNNLLLVATIVLIIRELREGC